MNSGIYLVSTQLDKTQTKITDKNVTLQLDRKLLQMRENLSKVDFLDIFSIDEVFDIANNRHSGLLQYIRKE
jgi:hypothetical protein